MHKRTLETRRIEQADMEGLSHFSKISISFQNRISMCICSATLYENGHGFVMALGMDKDHSSSQRLFGCAAHSIVIYIIQPSVPLIDTAYAI